jgi:hypothetical protein
MLGLPRGINGPGHKSLLTKENPLMCLVQKFFSTALK